MKKFALALATTAICCSLAADSADARGRTYVARDPQTGAITKYLTLHETSGMFPGYIMDLRQVKDGAQPDTATFTAAGFLNSKYVTVRAASKTGANAKTYTWAVPDLKYNIQSIDAQEIVLAPDAAGTEQDKLLAVALPGKYTFYDRDHRYPNELAAKVLFEHIGTSIADIHNKSAIKVTQKLIPDINVFGPRVGDEGPGYYFDITNADETEYMGRVVIDARLENMWEILFTDEVRLLYTMDINS